MKFLTPGIPWYPRVIGIVQSIAQQGIKGNTDGVEEKGGSRSLEKKGAVAKERAVIEEGKKTELILENGRVEGRV
jgi:hypothetical protein